ncbi:MAG: NAD(P)H-hydrate dehydratase [Bacteroidaceae bacterium]|nr:NAD(P)H-hydrate dehydratase [Bacteroidaceae bacterium]
MEFITQETISSMLKPRPKDGHKGTFGHALLVAGKYGMAGACVLASRACLRSGAGKLTAHIAQRNNDIVQVSVPEAIIQHDDSLVMFTGAVDLSNYDALGIGPGLGTDEATAFAVHDQLLNARRLDIPTVIDADALNILAMYPQWWNDIPGRTVITPHAGEYARLEKAGLDFGRVTLVKKGHNTVITAPGKTSYVCPWGNSGMATAGSGDVLTGMILSFLAQGYGTAEAAVLGVAFHAMAGDKAASVYGEHSMTASDIVDNIRI